MTETHNEFHDAQGSPIHTGAGDINPVYISFQESVKNQRSAGPRSTDKGNLEWLQQRFVVPPNLGAARDHLRENRTVLLVGPRGCGLSTAAKMLLKELINETTPYAELADEAELLDERLADSTVHPGHRLILDLTESKEEVLRRRLRDLPSFHAALQKNDAFLAVVVPEARAHQIDSDLNRHIVRLDRPRGLLVLRRHLEAAGIFLPDHHLITKDLSALLTGPMREIEDLARDVISERAKAPDDEPATWLSRAVSAEADRSKEVADQLKAHTRGRTRTVLLAAAMCQGASSDAVFFASHRLVELLSLGEDEKPRLEQDGYRTQLDELRIDVADNQVDFSKKYGDALRKYFWDNYPDLRQRFCEWVDQVIRMGLLTHQDRESLVDRFVVEALRTRSLGHMTWLIERWVFPGANGPNRLRDYGVRVLLAGLEHERHGRWFRQLVYDWSRRNDLPAEVGQLLVDVCAQVIALNSPNQAVVRLHNRARREDGTGSPTARQALVALTEDNPILFRLLLSRLEAGLQRQQPWQADYFLFLDIADPWRLADYRMRSQSLAADPMVRPQLVACWRMAMFYRPDLILPRLHDWLAAAGQAAPYDLLLGILVEAVSPSIKHLAELHVNTRDWSHTVHGRPEIAVRVSQLIDMAQGLHATDYMFNPRPEEAVR